MREFKFEVDPAEDLDTRWERWDREVMALQSEGLTVRGTGPDGDDPLRFEGPYLSDLAGPYTEIYEVVPLHFTDEDAERTALAAHSRNCEDSWNECREWGGHCVRAAEEILTALTPAVERIRREAKVEAWDEGFTRGWYAAGAKFNDPRDASEAGIVNPYEPEESK